MKLTMVLVVLRETLSKLCDDDQGEGEGVKLSVSDIFGTFDESFGEAREWTSRRNRVPPEQEWCEP